MTDKTIEQYLNDPELIPEDLGELEGLLSGTDAAAGDPASPRSETKAIPVDAAVRQTEQDERLATSGQEGQPQAQQGMPAYIASKDGKHTIPYSVLASEREKRAAAERLVHELSLRMQEIESRMAGSQRADVEPQQAVAMLNGESVEELLADFPQLAPLLNYTQQLEQQLSGVSSRFSQVERAEYQRQQERFAQASSEIRAAVDANPHLRYWEHQDPDRWEAAIAADTQLRQLPVNQGLSMRDRFAKVVQVVEAIYGPTEFPEEFRPNAPAAPNDVTGAVKKAVQSAAPVRPISIGEIPGGTPVKGDELEEILSRSPQELGSKLAAMSPEQIVSLLDRLG